MGGITLYLQANSESMAAAKRMQKRQEKSEFWCAENRLEVIRQVFAGKNASFERFFVNY